MFFPYEFLDYKLVHMVYSSAGTMGPDSLLDTANLIIYHYAELFFLPSLYFTR